MQAVQEYKYVSIRQKRRKRWLVKKHLRELDQKSLNAINKSYMWYMDIWGGTRCPKCGLGVRPHWLTNLSGRIPKGYITAFGVNCQMVKNCIGEKPDWELKAIEKYVKKGL